VNIADDIFNFGADGNDISNFGVDWYHSKSDNPDFDISE
jgi:hypothetical protein